MSDAVLLDNDVLLKMAAYRLAGVMFESLCGGGRPAVLGAARFVLLRRIERTGAIRDRSAVTIALREALDRVDIVELSDGEIAVASDLVGRAQQSAVDLDAGEALLLAALITRGHSILITGDKRAVYAVEVVSEAAGCATATSGRLACLEQVFLALLRSHPAADLKRHVCLEPSVDVALSICFSCSSQVVDEASVLEGLSSYVADLRRRAPGCLLPDSELGLFDP